MTNLDTVKKAIYEADEIGSPKAIFDLIDEGNVWKYAQALLDDPDEGYILGPTLLDGIGATLEMLDDLATAYNTLYYALNTSFDSLVYNAAQKAVLRRAQRIDQNTTRRFQSRFTANYQETMQNGDQFIAGLALEGAVMLPILRQDRRLLYESINLLLNHFPLIPNDPRDPAFLAVKAVKLVGRCYDLQPSHAELVKLVEEMASASNIAVNLEATFTLGIIKLYEAFQASELETLKSILEESLGLFEKVQNTEENRSDAEFLSLIIQCYLMAQALGNEEELAKKVQQAQTLLIERLLAFSGATSFSWANIEFSLAQMVNLLESWSHQLRTVKGPEVHPEMSLLASIYASLRELEVRGELLELASTSWQKWVMLPQVTSHFVQIQDVESRLEYVLADQNWVQMTPSSEVEFYRLILDQIKESKSYPKVEAATQLGQIRVAANHDTLQFAKLINQLQSNGLISEETILQLLPGFVQRNQQQQPLLAPAPAQDIFDKIYVDLQKKLDWKSDSIKWFPLIESLATIANYFYVLFLTKVEPETKFLFAKSTGLGQEATERHLQRHFYNSMKFHTRGVTIEFESSEGAPGRPDLGLRCGDILFPIEVKREADNISFEHIHEQYVPQAQSYAAGTNQICFLFVLDVTDKDLKTPEKHVTDYWYIDQYDVLDAQRYNWVIVVIFPANRYRPSDRSWKKRKA